MTRQWSVDPKSYELAEHFAQGESLTEDELKEFSQAIQDCCEDWLRHRGTCPGTAHGAANCTRESGHEGPCG